MAKLLDLDALDDTISEVVIKLKGVEHKLIPISVRDFVANTKAIQELALAEKGLEDEVHCIITMIQRSVPTISVEELKDLPLLKLNAILDFVKKHNGEEKVEPEAASDAPANPPAVTSESSTSATP